MTWNTWLRRLQDGYLSSRRSRRPGAKPRRRAGRPAMEALEDRLAPADLNNFLTNEHVDINLSYAAGTNAWTLQHQDDDNLVSYDTDDALLYVGAPALTTRVAGSAFDFIGVAAGQTFYRLPQSQDPNLPYLGVAGYGTTPADFDRYNPSAESKGRASGLGRWVKVSLVGVQHTTPAGAAGTGQFSVWQSGDTGPVVFMSTYNDGVSNPDGNGLDTTDGIGPDDALWVVAGGHLHYNWGFTQKGRYEVTVKLSGYLNDGNTTSLGTYVESGPFTVYFSVGSVGQLEFDASTYTVDEGAGTASVKVRRVNGSDGRITVNYATSDGTATAGDDYTATSGALTFNDGEREKFITIPILNDIDIEGNETVNLALSGPGPASIAGYVASPSGDNSSLLGAQATAVLTIIDNDEGIGLGPTISDVPDQSTNEDTPTTVSFTVNDAQTPAADLVVTATSSNTTLVPNANLALGGSGANRTLTITPAANLFGTTTITLTVTDGDGKSATDTFVLTVLSVNDAPTISDVPDQATDEDTPTAAIPFTVGDIETAAGSLVVTAASSNTTLIPNANIALGGSGANRTVTVTPAANQSGTATITLTVTDAEGATATDSFVLTVNPVNDAPTISDVPDQATDEDTPTAAIAFTVGDAETAAGSLVVTATSSNTALVPNANIALAGSGADRSVTITPAANAFGTTTITLTVTDEGGLTATDAFVLTVNAVNDLPTISDIPNQSIPLNGTAGPVGFTVGDVETAAGSLVVTATSSNTALVPNANIALAGSGADRTITVTPAAGQSGTATITVTVTDADGGTATDTFVLSVSANTPPTISTIADQTIDEDSSAGPISFTVGDAETPAADLTLSATSSNLTLLPVANIVFGGSGVNRTVTVTPVANGFGTATITVTVDDGNGGTASDSFVLTVNPVNDLPTISDVADQATDEDTPTGAIAFTVGDVETAAGSLVVTATSSNTALVPNANITLGGSGANRTVTITPAANQSGTATITVTVTDADGGAATDTFVLTVNAVNDPPTADPQSVSTDEDTPRAITLTGSDVEGSPLTFIVVTGPAHGVLSGTGANRTYTPNLDYTGPDSFTFKVNDGSLDSAVATVSITVGAVNDPPTISDLPDQATDEDTPTAAIPFTVGDAETAAGSLVVTATSSNTALVPNANIALAGSGADRSVTITPAANAFGTTTITLTVTDADGGSATDTFVLTVNPVNDAPEANDDAYAVHPGNAVFGNVLFNDTDPDGDALTSGVLAGPAHGALALNGNGTFTYTPSATFTGLDTFTYTVSDGNGGTATATVTITLPGGQHFEVALSTEHVDVGVAYEDGGWDLHVHDEDNDQEYEAYDALLHVGAAAITTRSGGLADAAFDFLGVAAGQTFYRLPQTPNPELLYLGIGAEEVEDGTFLGDTLTLRLKAVNGPGHFSLWQSDDAGPIVYMATSDGITTGDALTVLTGGHAHFNWAFTARGGYEVTFEATATLPDGSVTSSGDVTYRFVVNTAATANDDAYSVNEDATLTVGGAGVLGNDVDPDGDPLVTALVQGPANGTVRLNPDGSFTYTPNANFNGTDSFTYVVTDVRYRVVPLGTLGGNNSFALDVNNNRQVTGNSSINAGTSNPLQAFLWKDGTFTPIGVLPGTGSNNFSRGFAVNDDGVVVGESDNNVPKAFRWEAGVNENLGTLGGTSAVAHDINTDGVIVGISSNGTASKPFVWVNGVMTPLPTVTNTAASTGRAWSISDNGKIAGVSRVDDAAFRSHATLWLPDGSGGYTAYDLGALVSPAHFSQAYAVNDDGAVVGSSVVGKVSPTSSTDLYHGFIYVDGQMIDTRTLGYLPNFIHSETKDVNAFGQYVGYVAQFFNAPSFGGAATLGQLVDGKSALVDLNRLIPGGSGWTLWSAEGINKGGDIVGFGSFGGFTRAFLLTPVVTDIDGELFSNAATVTITVAAVNDAPVANDQSVTTPEDTAKAITLTGSDIDGDALTYIVVAGPSHGTLSGSGANLTYTPNPDYNGPDSFTFKVNDGQADSNIATVTITVNPVNDAPEANDDAYAVHPGNAVFGNVLFNDTDPDGDALTSGVLAGPAHGALVLNANGTFTYTPGATFTGLDTFTYAIDDGNGGTATATVTITAAGTQDFAVILKTEHVDVGVAYEDGGWDLHVHDEDNDQEYEPDEALLYVGPQALTTRPAGAAFDFLGVAAGQTYYRLPQSLNPELLYLGIGGEEIEGGTFLGGTVALRLKAVNGPGHFAVWQSDDAGPAVYMATSDGVTAADFVTVFEGDHDHFNWGFTARGRYEVTFEAVATLPDGTITMSGDVTYYFSVDNLGRVQFNSDAFTVDEGGNVTITVRRVDGSDGPATVSYEAVGITAGAGDFAPLAGDLTFADGETTKTLTFVANHDNLVEGNETVRLTLAVPPDSCAMLGTPAEAVITIRDDAPTAVNDSFTAVKNTPLTVPAPGVLSNDSDPQGEALTAVLVTAPNPAHGTVTLTANGSFTFTPAAGFVGTATFTYKANDGNADSNVATVTITVAEPQVQLLAVLPYSNNPATEGTEQRSMIRHARLFFDAPVYFGAGAVQLRQHDSEARGTTATAFSGVRNVGLTLVGSGFDAATGRYFYNFAVSGTVGREVSGSLEDGRYEIVLNAALVTTGPGGTGQKLRPDNGGGTVSRRFHRLFGDVNGDGLITSVDQSRFDSAYGSRVGMLNYINFLDFENNRSIDGSDRTAFNRRKDRFGLVSLAW